MNTTRNRSNKQIFDEMTELKTELKQALERILEQIGKKLKPSEKDKIRMEIKDIQELIQRLKNSYIYVALFGNTSVGKSAIANSLVGADLAEVGIEHDLTQAPQPYEKDSWRIVDVPGILGNQVQQDIAIEEANKAHGHIFVIQGEPYGPELELFNLIHQKQPDAPKIVFVNKWDIVEATRTKKDIETIQTRIWEKMGKFVNSPEDIVYGSAELFDRDRDEKVRQELPKLLERMYENAGTLGQMINILDPAKRSEDLSQSIREKIFKVREKLARKVITVCALVSAFTGAVPFSEATETPSLWIGMVTAIIIIMGIKKDPTNPPNVAKIVGEISLACAQTLGVVFVATAGAAALIDMATTATTWIADFGAAIGLGVDVIALGVFKFRRTAILGEAAIEYVRNDFSWGPEGAEAVIKKCKKRVEEQYNYLKKRNKK